MENRPLAEWPKAVGTYRDHIGDPTHIEVYADHEFPDHAALYLCFPNGSKQPARTVAPGNWEHWSGVLTSWNKTAPLKDMREIREPPLPTDVADWQI